MRRIVLGLVGAGSIVSLAVACATGLVQPEDSPDGGLADAATGDSGCPGVDLTNDPKHCGSCTKVCNFGTEVCSNGACKAACDLPTVKCPSDAGGTCADLKTDVTHCGTCMTSCKTADAGALAPGNGNPPDAGALGYDAGSGMGWSVGTPACDGGGCGIACPPGMSTCSDGICYDQKNFHDHCGSCSTACMPDTEWCNNGQCCPLGQVACNGMCVDTSSDNANCGACGNACSGQTPYCSQGTCVKGCVPTGARAGFNTLASHTTTGCWLGNPCGQDNWNFSSSYGQNFQANGQQFVCSGPSTCVGHVGVTTYSDTKVCEGAWDVYCDNNKVGNINTVGKACTGSAQSNGCSIAFTPAACTSVKVVATGGSGVQNCCAGQAPDSMIVSISAW